MRRALVVALLLALAPGGAHARDATPGGAEGPSAAREKAVGRAAAAARKPAPRRITVAELESLRGRQGIAVVDASAQGARAKYGFIPGATLLSSPTDYDPARELPASRSTTLVFYCADERCKDSHAAARRAIEAGWRDVAVLPAGVLGWKRAGRITFAFDRG